MISLKHIRINRILLIFALIATILSCNTSRRTISIEEGWELLGESKVNFITDKDQVDVISSSQFTAIRFKVEKKDIHLSNLNIVYQNGDKLNPVMDDNLVADQYSRDIELSTDGKMIRSIDFKYRSKGNILKGRANVLVFGKRWVAPAPVQIEIKKQ